MLNKKCHEELKFGTNKIEPYPAQEFVRYSQFGNFRLKFKVQNFDNIILKL